MTCKTCKAPMQFVVSKREHGRHEEIEWCEFCGTMYQHNRFIGNFFVQPSSEEWCVPKGAKT